MRGLKYVYNAFMQLKIEHMNIWSSQEKDLTTIEMITSTRQFKDLLEDVRCLISINIIKYQFNFASLFLFVKPDNFVLDIS